MSNYPDDVDFALMNARFGEYSEISDWNPWNDNNIDEFATDAGHVLAACADPLRATEAIFNMSVYQFGENVAGFADRIGKPKYFKTCRDIYLYADDDINSPEGLRMYLHDTCILEAIREHCATTARRIEKTLEQHD